MNETVITTTWNAIGSGIGGFLGVSLFSYLTWRHTTKPKHIYTYYAANDFNQGQAQEHDGELKHHYGKRTLPNSDKHVDVDHPVWEWSRTPTEGNSDLQGDAVLFGPYSTDFNEPGMYSVTFRIKGIGFTQPEQVISDFNLIELDINQRRKSEVLNEWSNFQNSRRFIRLSKLARTGWHDYELTFYSDARGVWEYRAFVFDGSRGNRADNMGRCGEGCRILFDTVKIHKLGKWQAPKP